MPIDLDDYQAAFERVEQQELLRRDWGPTEARIQRILRRPDGRLVKSLVVFAVCIAAGALGVVQAWLVAGGVALAVLPDRFRERRARHRALLSLEGAEDVRALCREEVSRRSASAFLGGLAMAALGLTFLATGFVAWLLDKDPRPGLFAGSITVAWGAVKLLVLFPRAVREERLLGDDEDEGDEGDDEDEDDA